MSDGKFFDLQVNGYVGVDFNSDDFIRLWITWEEEWSLPDRRSRLRRMLDRVLRFLRKFR